MQKPEILEFFSKIPALSLDPVRMGRNKLFPTSRRRGASKRAQGIIIMAEGDGKGISGI